MIDGTIEEHGRIARPETRARDLEWAESEKHQAGREESKETLATLKDIGDEA